DSIMWQWRVAPFQGDARSRRKTRVARCPLRSVLSRIRRNLWLNGGGAELESDGIEKEAAPGNGSAAVCLLLDGRSVIKTHRSRCSTEPSSRHSPEDRARAARPSSRRPSTSWSRRADRRQR